MYFHLNLRHMLTSPSQHNLATTMDKAPIQEAYMEVMADKNNTEW